MAKQNSVNLDITNNADGFSIAGGSTSRTLGISGADITLVGSGTATLTFPTTSTTIAGLGITQEFTALQSFSTGISAAVGVTFANTLQVGQTATFLGNISAPNIVNSVNGATGEINLVSGTGITISQSGNTLTISSTASGSSGGVTEAFVIAMAIAL